MSHRGRSNTRWWASGRRPSRASPSRPTRLISRSPRRSPNTVVNSRCRSVRLGHRQVESSSDSDPDSFLHHRERPGRQYLSATARHGRPPRGGPAHETDCAVPRHRGIPIGTDTRWRGRKDPVAPERGACTSSWLLRLFLRAMLLRVICVDRWAESRTCTDSRGRSRTNRRQRTVGHLLRCA